MHLRIQENPQTNFDAVLSKAATLQAKIETVSAVIEAGGYTDPHASVNAVSDTDTMSAVADCIEALRRPELRYIFVVGIGGSNLGTKAVYNAVRGYADVATADRVQMLFLDTINDQHCAHYFDTLIPAFTSPDEYAVVTISKTGGTAETIMNTELLVAALTDAAVYDPARVVAITDQDSALYNAAEAAGWYTLAIPDVVGGRYSVFTAVGVFPLGLAGIDTNALLAGAQDMRSYCVLPEVAHNPAAQSAAYFALEMEAGRTISDSFIFHTELESLGKWYRQLLGESIGKERNLQGEVVHTGITPTVSIGSTDLHSVGQLYLGGPKDKVTTFMYTSDDSTAQTMPAKRVLPGVVSMIDGKRSSALRLAILEGTKRAYEQNELPYLEIVLDAITPYELGAYMQYKMIEMMYLGDLLAVNPFDQPNVEAYKVETRRLLEDS